LEKEEEAIAGRLWQLESSISGKSLHVLALLQKNKRIKPPSKVAKMLQDHLVTLEAKRASPQPPK
jgi:hypothetical protein